MRVGIGTKRNDWGAQVGDWHPGPWLKGGLKPIVDYTHSKGLKFGLWMEAESLGSHTQFYKDHPEFLARRDGKPAYDGRGLDMANPKVAAWVESEMARVISEYKLDLFRLDYNVTDTHGGGNRVIDGFTENTMWRHYEAFYAILERLRKRFPNVIMENCAGGGAAHGLRHSAQYAHHLGIGRVNHAAGGEDPEWHDAAVAAGDCGSHVRHAVG